MQTALRSGSMNCMRTAATGPRQLHQHVCQPVSPAAAPIRRWQPCPQQQLQQEQQQQRSVHARAFQFKQGPDAADRVLAALPYLLPLLDALPYGERACWSTNLPLPATPAFTVQPPQQHRKTPAQSICFQLGLECMLNSSACFFDACRAIHLP